jgi:hypothetical protein
LETEVSQLAAAKRALELPVKEEMRLKPVREEIAGLKVRCLFSEHICGFCADLVMVCVMHSAV